MTRRQPSTMGKWSPVEIDQCREVKGEMIKSRLAGGVSGT
jgi:hypothetical protein